MIFTNSDTIRLYENEMLDNIEQKMRKADNSDTIMKYFRHGKIWLTNHRYVAKACTKDRYEELNASLNSIKNKVLIDFECNQHWSEYEKTSM